MPTSRMVRAISLGVFCRLAPSTNAIIRSRNELPGSTEMRMTTRSETMRVPPVTAERSPPDSRMTGADSPVMADSSTVAMPKITSPSPGMVSPVSHSTKSPLRNWLAGVSVQVTASGLVTLRAVVSVRVRRSDSAWALPRPSAMASAKLANNTVNHSQPAIWPIRPDRWRVKSMVHSTAATAVANITGLRIKLRGSIFNRASLTAARKIGPSNNDRAWG